jgi:hypothetical protein
MEIYIKINVWTQDETKISTALIGRFADLYLTTATGIITLDITSFQMESAFLNAETEQRDKETCFHIQ